MTTNSTPSFADRTVIGVNELNAQAAPKNLKDVANDAALVGQIRQVFDDGKQSSVIVDVELLSVEWAFQFSIENESKSERTKQMET